MRSSWRAWSGMISADSSGNSAELSSRNRTPTPTGTFGSTVSWSSKSAFGKPVAGRDERRQIVDRLLTRHGSGHGDPFVVEDDHDWNGTAVGQRHEGPVRGGWCHRRGRRGCCRCGRGSCRRRWFGRRWFGGGCRFGGRWFGGRRFGGRWFGGRWFGGRWLGRRRFSHRGVEHRAGRCPALRQLRPNHEPPGRRQTEHENDARDSLAPARRPVVIPLVHP